MILPYSEGDYHCVEVVGMFCLEDNNEVLVEDDFLCERLARVSRDKGILLMGSDKGCCEREIDEKLVDGAVMGGFPNLYSALAGNLPDQVITL